MYTLVNTSFNKIRYRCLLQYQSPIPQMQRSQFVVHYAKYCRFQHNLLIWTRRKATTHAHIHVRTTGWGRLLVNRVPKREQINPFQVEKFKNA